MAQPVSFANNTATPKNGSEHSNRECFPMERELRFRTKDKRSEITGSGWTIGMSSKSLRFRTDKALKPGKRIEMAVSWPAKLDNRCALKLLARGKILSSEPGVVAVSIEQYEFRTLGASGLAT
jgi:hypothetical protein